MYRLLASLEWSRTWNWFSLQPDRNRLDPRGSCLLWKYSGEGTTAFVYMQSTDPFFSMAKCLGPYFDTQAKCLSPNNHIYQHLRQVITKKWPAHLLRAPEAPSICRPATIQPLAPTLPRFWILLELFPLRSRERTPMKKGRWLREVLVPNITSDCYLDE